MRTSTLLLVLVGATLFSCDRDPVEVVPQPPLNTEATIRPVVDCAGFGGTEDMASIRGGSYIPMYGSDSLPVRVGDFLLDVYPVTNAQFREFVGRDPNWERSQVKKLFGDGNYLRSWTSDTLVGEEHSLRAPVTEVSWFAANAYCECAGKRLATVKEWEYVAMADRTRADARKDETYTRHILEWYEKRNAFEAEVGSTYKNYWGVYDLHGLIWEWTADFSSVLMEDDARKGTSGSDEVFCGSATLGAADLENYAAFMRYAFRASLKAKYSIHNLGFRCAKDLPEVETL